MKIEVLTISNSEKYVEEIREFLNTSIKLMSALEWHTHMQEIHPALKKYITNEEKYRATLNLYGKSYEQYIISGDLHL